VPTDYRDWADRHKLGGPRFWFYALAAGNHAEYWEDGTILAAQLADRRVELILTDDAQAIEAMIREGEDLLNAWSLDGLDPALVSGRSGHWHFEGHNEAETIKVNGSLVLDNWRRARPADWHRTTAIEYARSVQALLYVRRAANRIAGILGPASDATFET
jgi:hypothetical protein